METQTSTSMGGGVNKKAMQVRKFMMQGVGGGGDSNRSGKRKLYIGTYSTVRKGDKIN